MDLRNRGFHVQAYADDVAILVTGTNMMWIKVRAQKALNIASNWALNQELQFSSKKTEIVLFTNKRRPAFGTLRLNGRQQEISIEATLLGETLDSKLTRKPHITRIARKATVALLQCRQIVGRAWGLNPTNMRWIYTAMIRPVITYACVSWVGGANKKYLAKKLSKVKISVSYDFFSISQHPHRSFRDAAEQGRLVVKAAKAAAYPVYHLLIFFFKKQNFFTYSCLSYNYRQYFF